jgi:hypothetical protein
MISLFKKKLMRTAPARPFNLDHEIEKCRMILLLPITGIEFAPGYEYGKLLLDDNQELKVLQAKLFVNDELIGTIPYYNLEAGYGYPSHDRESLAWEKVYGQYEQTIMDQVRLQEPAAAHAEHAGYGRLFVQDKHGTTIKLAYCNFVYDDWRVVVTGLDVQTKAKVTSVKLAPPVPPGHF